MSTQLNRITTPDLTRSDFGRALSEQFANIDINFQKLGNIELSKGDSGKSCAYIVYNLNSIFVYPTCTMAENAKEYNNFIQFQQLISTINEFDKDNTVDKALIDHYQVIKSEVERDYEIYYAHTGGSTAEYTQMCAFLLWGSRNVFVERNTFPTDTSLTGALWISKSAELQTPLDVKDSSGIVHKYYSVWLRDWYLTGGADTWGQGTPIELSEKLTLYKDHILLFDPGKITIACTPALEPSMHAVGEFEPVGSLAYVHIDPRFRNENTGSLLKDINMGASQGQVVYEDISCVLYWEPRDFHGGPGIPAWSGGFKAVNLFPQIYFDGSGFFWKINGNNTRIPVTGTEGAPGKNSQFVVVERVENVIGASPNNPQGDWERYKDAGYACGPWLPEAYEKGQTIVVNAQSGRTSRVETLRGKRAAEFQEAYSQVPGIENEVTNVNTTPQQAAVLSYKVYSKTGWLVDSAGVNNTEIEHAFRILRLVGKEFFWDTDKTPTTDNIFRPLDPTFAAYNYGNEDAVFVSKKQEIQQLIASLDGCPCLVVPGPAFRPDRTDSTVWFSTLKAVRINDKDTRLQLIAYCGIENQMTTNLDDHSLAGHMHELDAYTYKVTGDFRNKPRGLMLPIGSANVYSSNKDDIWASHIIHADLGGFVRRNKVEDNKHGEYYWGEQQQITDKNSKPVLGLNIPADSLDNKGHIVDTHQFLEVIKKRFIHIGSVNDFRTLNYVDGLETGERNYNAAVPGRRRNVGRDWESIENIKGEKVDYYGHSGFWGEPTRTGNNWFLGSELHIDEPVTITRYRDLQKRKHLLNVEGDVSIGMHRHVNDPNIEHRCADGGLIIQSTISEELKEKIKNDINESIFDTIFLDGLILQHENFINISPSNVLRTNLTRSIDRVKRGRYQEGFRGQWNTPSTDDIYPNEMKKPTDAFEHAKKSFASLLVEDMIGARMITSLDGFAVYDQNPISDEWKNMTDSPWCPVKFSVDYEGNMQTYGREVRSNNPNTLWGFHTDWVKTDVIYKMIGDKGKYEDDAKNPDANQLVFGTSHKYLDETDESFYWRAVNEESYIFNGARATKDTTRVVQDGTEFVLPARATDLPTGWMTEIGYMDGLESLNAGEPRYKISFDTLRNTINSMSNGSALIPTIIRVWTDLLHQQGSLTVAGISMLPVRTAMDGANYFTRFGIQAEYGMIIGSAGRSSIATKPGLDGKTEDLRGNELQIPYTANAEMRLCMLDDGLYGTTGAGVGQGDSYYGVKPKIQIDMFNLDKTYCNPGLWVRQSGAVVDKTLIVGEDLSVNRAGTVRGQLRAKSFRRHVNSLNLGKLYPIFNADDSYTHGAIMLDRGWSTSRAKDISFTKTTVGNAFSYEPQPLSADIKEAPIVLDMGPVYKNMRFVKFGIATLPTIDGEGLIRTEPDKPDDRTAVLYGVSPVQDKFIRKTGGRLWAGKNYNKFELIAQSNGLLASITLKINLDWHMRALDHKNGGKWGWGHARWCHTIGINPNAHMYPNGDSINNAQPASFEGEGVEAVFDGWKWDELLGDFPKPLMDIASNVPAIAASNVGRLAASDEQLGIRFVLSSDGTLRNDYSIGAGAMLSASLRAKSGRYTQPYPAAINKKLIISFVYPIAIITPNQIIKYGVSKSPLVKPTTMTDTKADASETNPVIWRKVYIGSLQNPDDVDWDEIEWEIIEQYSKKKVEHLMSAAVKRATGEDGDEREEPDGAQKTFDWNNIRWENYEGDMGVDWVKFLDEQGGPNYNYVWGKTTTDYFDPAENKIVSDVFYEILGERNPGGGGGSGQTRDIKVLLSGIIYRTYVGEDNATVHKGDTWKTDRCYGPAAEDFHISFGGFHDGHSAQMIIGFKNEKWMPTSCSANLSQSTAHTVYDVAPKGTGGGTHWFSTYIDTECTEPIVSAYKRAVTIREYHLSTGANAEWVSDFYGKIIAISVTIFGYEQ